MTPRRTSIARCTDVLGAGWPFLRRASGPAPDEGRPIIAYPCRIPRITDDPFDPARAIVVLNDLEAKPLAPERRIGLIFGPTPSEARLAVQVGAGESVESAADRSRHHPADCPLRFEGSHAQDRHAPAGRTGNADRSDRVGCRARRSQPVISAGGAGDWQTPAQRDTPRRRDQAEAEPCPKSTSAPLPSGSISWSG
jgi:hypothetical protein